MIFNLIRDGSKHYLCMKDEWFDTRIHTGYFFKFQKSHPLFSENIKTDKQHSIIEKELVELIWTLKENEDYSYDELIRPLLRAAMLKNIGI